MTNKKIGVGIIGVNPNRGWAWVAHVPALRALGGYKVVAVSNSDIENAKVAAETIGAPHYFSSNDDLVACPDVDLVVVTVKVPFHKELVTAAIKAGKSVYSEWPLGNGLEEALEMEKLAGERGVRAHVGLQSRAAPVIRYLRELIAGGYVGEVLSTTIVATSSLGGGFIDQPNAYILDKSNGANLLSIAGGHTLDAVCFCLGEFIEIFAVTAVRRETALNVDTHETIPATSADQVIVGGILEGGAPLSLHYRGGDVLGETLSWEIQGTEKNLRLSTREGSYTAVDDMVLEEYSGKELGYVALDVPEVYTIVPIEVPRGTAFNVAQNYALLEQDIRTGTTNCPSFSDAVQRHRMLAAIEAAGETGVRQQHRIR